MAKMVLEDIPIDLIEVGRSQARVTDIEEGVDDLAENIKVHGLLHPVIVFKKDGKYELLSGQRRVLAVRKLGWKSISAHIVAQPEDELMAKALSVSENITVQPVAEQDYVDACTSFFRKYGNMKLVAEKLGLPYHKVVKYVKYERLPKEVKEMYDNGKIKLDKALKAVDLATKEDGKVDEKEAFEIAEEITKMTGSQVQSMKRVKDANPEAKAGELVEAGKEAVSVKQIRIELLTQDYEALKKFKKNEGKSSEEEAAAELVVEGLKNRGLFVE